ncbi:hypothetical protein [Pararhizobium qamdonense]|uniref:hypothetical protein n=1 Tax=Pararhizobium qamdonense TaxID=3031126 RepID=UPI0023E258C9|nr:hypothetical protein [Pararhizobium qamdonense]
MSALNAKIKPYVDELDEAVEAGDATAIRIRKLYIAHVADPSDLEAPALCDAALDEWLKARTKH